MKPSLSTFLMGLLITLTVVVGNAMTTFEVQNLTDLRVWLVGVATGCIRQAGIYIVRELALRRGMTDE